MKIYTRTGDAGETGLFGGARVGKDDPRVEAYGTVDELNSCLGVARALGPSRATDEALQQIQSDLFTVGAELACVPGKEDKLRLVTVAEADIARLEGWIDGSEAPLEPLKNFVLPGGCPAAAELHRAPHGMPKGRAAHADGQPQLGDSARDRDLPESVERSLVRARALRKSGRGRR